MKKTILSVAISIIAFSKIFSQESFYPTKEIKVIKQSSKYYIYEVLQSEEIITYSYENNLVSKIITVSAKGDTIENVSVKYENARLKQIHCEVTTDGEKTVITRIYNYKDDLITSVDSNEDGIKYSHIFYYNTNRLVKKEKIFRDGNFDGERNNKYFKSGNISEENVSSSQFNYIDVYKSYDDKNNPFGLIFPSAYLKIYGLPKNNVLSCRLDNNHYTYEYVYNLNNYPLKITEKSVGGKKTITTIEYE